MTTNHVALARKYRPKKFGEIVGQEIATTVLRNTICNGKIHHAYLLTGTRGVGKTTIARIIAKALNCINIAANATNCEPCCACACCVAIDQGSMIDVIEIDAASNTGVDNIREVIDNAKYAPSESKYKIYIIDEVHMLSKSAFNAMLKTLEEPPSHVIFILATTELHKIPITILSRCLQIKLRNLHSNEISQHLHRVLEQENVTHEQSALELIAKFAHGSMRDALSLTDQAIAFSNGNISQDSTNTMLGNSDEDTIHDMLNYIIQQNSSELVTLAQTLYNNGYNLEICLENLAHTLQKIAVAQLTSGSTDDNLTNYAQAMDVNSVQLYFEICNLGLNQLKQVNDKYSTFVMTLLRMLAFNIGNRQQKQSAVENLNSINQAPSLDTKTATKITQATSIDNTPLKVATDKILVATDILDTTPSSIDLPRVEFDGNWLQLVRNLKSVLRHSAPFLDSSELVEFSGNKLHIRIDKRYQTSFSEHTHQELTTALNDYFHRPLELAYEFFENLTETLKEFDHKEQQQKQQNAQQAIHDDTKLIDMMKQFSATILPGSIKPKLGFN